MTHVKKVGLINASSSTCVRFFFVALVFSKVCLVPAAFRLPLSAASWLEMEGLLRARVEGESGRDMLAAVGRTGPASSDSGTIRKPIGSLLVTVLLPWFRFGRPRAAAAPMDKSVVRLARRAAS